MDKETQIIALLQEINRSLVKAIRLMEFLVGEKIKADAEAKRSVVKK